MNGEEGRKDRRGYIHCTGAKHNACRFQSSSHRVFLPASPECQWGVKGPRLGDQGLGSAATHWFRSLLFRLHTTSFSSVYTLTSSKAIYLRLSVLVRNWTSKDSHRYKPQCMYATASRAIHTIHRCPYIIHLGFGPLMRAPYCLQYICIRNRSPRKHINFAVDASSGFGPRQGPPASTDPCLRGTSSDNVLAGR